MSIHDKILEERGSRYGDFDDIAEISQTLKDMWYMKANLDFKEPTDTMNEAMEMVLHKLARMINGDRYYEDNIIDMQNYLELYRQEVIKSNTNTPKEEKDSTEPKEEPLNDMSEEEFIDELVSYVNDEYIKQKKEDELIKELLDELSNEFNFK